MSKSPNTPSCMILLICTGFGHVGHVGVALLALLHSFIFALKYSSFGNELNKIKLATNPHDTNIKAYY